MTTNIKKTCNAVLVCELLAFLQQRDVENRFRTSLVTKISLDHHVTLDMLKCFGTGVVTRVTWLILEHTMVGTNVHNKDKRTHGQNRALAHGGTYNHRSHTIIFVCISHSHTSHAFS